MKKTKNNNYEDSVDEHEKFCQDIFGTSLPKFKINKTNYKKLNQDKKENTNDNSKDLNEKQEFNIFKYSKSGIIDLHEAVIINGLPFFIKYNSDKTEIEIVKVIEENSRILKPPQREEYPTVPYEFKSQEELNEFVKIARTTSLDEIFVKCKTFFSKFIDQDKPILVLLSADSLWSYFQDLFPTTHYIEGVGTNDVGKSSIGYTFEYIGYRPIKATAISSANYYRLLGFIEPGQCTIVEDEGDGISEDHDKIRILKSGYEYNGKVPKINMNSKNQEQKWYNTFCYKMILAEKSLSQSKARGLVDRTFSFNCRPGKVKYSIKDVVSENIHKNLKLQKTYQELLYFRKLLLCYRLIHYKDILPNITTGLENRDNELCKPLLQLFYGTKALNEIIDTLKIFVKQRRERKTNSLEAVLYPIIKGIINSESTNDRKIVEISFSKIWDEIKYSIEGYYDENKPNQYETLDYGIIYKNTLSKLISDKFGAKLNRKANGSFLIFEYEKFQRFDNMFESFLKDVEIDVKLEVEDEDDIKNDVGSEGSEGYNTCVTLFERNSITQNQSISIIEANKMNKENVDTYIPEPTLPTLPTLTNNNILNQEKKLLYCNHCDKFTSYEENEIVKHSINYHTKKPALPNKLMLEQLGLKPKGNPWEI